MSVLPDRTQARQVTIQTKSLCLCLNMPVSGSVFLWLQWEVHSIRISLFCLVCWCFESPISLGKLCVSAHIQLQTSSWSFRLMLILMLKLSVIQSVWTHYSNMSRIAFSLSRNVRYLIGFYVKYRGWLHLIWLCASKQIYCLVITTWFDQLPPPCR